MYVLLNKKMDSYFCRAIPVEQNNLKPSNKVLEKFSEKWGITFYNLYIKQQVKILPVTGSSHTI